MLNADIEDARAYAQVLKYSPHLVVKDALEEAAAKDDALAAAYLYAAAGHMDLDDVGYALSALQLPPYGRGWVVSAQAALSFAVGGGLQYVRELKALAERQRGLSSRVAEVAVRWLEREPGVRSGPGPIHALLNSGFFRTVEKDRLKRHCIEHGPRDCPITMMRADTVAMLEFTQMRGADDGSGFRFLLRKARDEWTIVGAELTTVY